MSSKKTFMSNLSPAMQFITPPTEASPSPLPQVETSPSLMSQPDPNSVYPSLASIKEKPPTGFKPNPLYIETKSKRLQLLMQPSLYKLIKAKAIADEVSVNEFIHSILEEAVKGDEIPDDDH